MQKRYTFINSMLNGTTQQGRKLIVDFIGWANKCNTPSDPNALIDFSIQYLLPRGLSSATKETMKTRTLLNNQTSDSYWTTAWNTYVSNPTTTNKSAAEARIKSMLSYILQLSEYHLM
jgi:hypothetical protein